MKRAGFLLGTALWMATGVVQTMAANSVVMESKSIPSGCAQVNVGIFLTNDAPVYGMAIPLEIRTTQGNAFIAGSFAATTQGRLSIYTGGSGATITYHIGNRTTYGEPQYLRCPLDSLGHVWIATDSVPDYISPDAFLYAMYGTADTAMYPGTDGIPGSGTPSVLLTFGVNNGA